MFFPTKNAYRFDQNIVEVISTDYLRYKQALTGGVNVLQEKSIQAGGLSCHAGSFTANSIIPLHSIA